jgi:hypothetical protein
MWRFRLQSAAYGNVCFQPQAHIGDTPPALPLGSRTSEEPIHVRQNKVLAGIVIIVKQEEQYE